MTKPKTPPSTAATLRRAEIRRMHREGIPLDAERVSGLLARQFPEWAHLPLESVARGTVKSSSVRADSRASVVPGSGSLCGLPFLAVAHQAQHEDHDDTGEDRDVGDVADEEVRVADEVDNMSHAEPGLPE